MALAFMGINQIANQLLNENPMTGYMNSVIFTRILGHDDIEQGSYWTDTNQCWICNRWNKIEVAINPMDDRSFLEEKIDYLYQVEHSIKSAVERSLG